MMRRTRLSLLLLLLVTCVAVPARGQERFEIRKAPAPEGRAKILSALYPGLGQLVTGHKGKGTAMVVAHTGFLVAWFTSHADYNTHEEQFALDEERYLALRDGGSFQEAEETWKLMADRKHDLDRAHLLRMSFGLLAAGLYSYNLIDALLLDGVSPTTTPALALQPRALHGGAGVALIVRFD
jgi:hypothetical protein